MKKITIKQQVIGLGTMLFVLASVIVLIAFKPEQTTHHETLVNADQQSTRSVQKAKHTNHTLYQAPTTTELKDFAPVDSLQGVEHSLAHLLDDQGRLIPDRSIRHMFDSYLSAMGEADLETLIQMMQAEINQAFDEPARSDALSLLNRYIDYKIELVDFETQQLPVDASDLQRIEQNQLALTSFRSQFFGTQEYDAFFANDEAHNAYMIEQMRINQNDTLAEEQKQKKLEQALSLLPEEAMQSRKKMLAHSELRTQVEQIRANGGSEEQVFAARQQVYGAQAAMDLQTLDAERATWQGRLDSFVRDKNQILASNLSSPDKDAAIHNLLADQFKPFEQKRVVALMGDGRL